jgi:demethylmenaquinone methyltransferase/2-methoxy-6-polyprenyl-1,4-benzoquinol methylase
MGKKIDFPLKEFYSDIYPTYDRVNRIFTFGRDVAWRKKAARECLLVQPERLLDVCTGTGDFILEIAQLGGTGITLTGYDFSPEMLEVARKKQRQLHERTGLPSIEFIEGDVGNMPFGEGHFDVLGITFGIRNLVYENSNARLHLSEIRRVMRTGGHLVILESSRPASRLWRAINNIYLQFILPYLGGLISGNMKAYRYLASSSKNYYSIKEMTQILNDAGFLVRKSRSLFLGSVMLVVATKE